jgi:hypothetical protein
MTEYDKKILTLFFSIFFFFLGITILSIIFSSNASLVDMVSGLFVSVTFGFAITGILAYKYYRKSAIITMKRLMKWFALVSLVIAVFVFLLIIFAAITVSNFPSNIGILIVMFIFLYLAMFIVIYLIIIVLMFAAFGMVGVLAALERAIAPEILLHVSRISASKAITKKKKRKISKLSTIDTVISWAFAIPDVLETKSLKINHGRPRDWFPWSNFYKAIFWQLLFGTVIIVYISFNPLYVKSELDFRNLFSIASNITIIVPFIILPWFIFLRLDAKIKGQVKDYKLYRGIVYRMYQTFFTLGTILIILRLGLERLNPEMILLASIPYYTFFMATIILVTFIYFNNFDNGLAWEVAKKYKQIKD